MEGVWKINPFYWIALWRLSRKQRKQTLAFQQIPRKRSRRQERMYVNLENLNPFRWSRRAVRVFATGFFTIMVPIYAYLGMQPAVSLEVPNTNQPNDYSTLQINSIHLHTIVEPLVLQEKQLVAPDSIAGSYSSADNKTFLIGHSSTVFKNLYQAQIEDIVRYNGANYKIVDITILEKNDIDMRKILDSTESPTLVLMTCAGDPLPNQDATHRLIITAIDIETTEQNTIFNYALDL